MPRIYFKRGRWHVEPIRQFLCFGVPENHTRNRLAEDYVRELNEKLRNAKAA